MSSIPPTVATTTVSLATTTVTLATTTVTFETDMHKTNMRAFRVEDVGSILLT